MYNVEKLWRLKFKNGKLYAYYILKTEINANGNEVFSRVKDGNKTYYIAIDENGRECPVTRDKIVNDENNIPFLNVAVSNSGSLRVSHANDGYIVRVFNTKQVGKNGEVKVNLKSVSEPTSLSAKCFVIETASAITLYLANNTNALCYFDKTVKKLWLPALNSGIYEFGVIDALCSFIQYTAPTYCSLEALKDIYTFIRFFYRKYITSDQFISFDVLNGIVASALSNRHDA